MLSNPKWIIFFFLFFGVAYIVGYMMNGIYSPNNLVGIDNGWDAIVAIKKILFFDYAWLEHGYLYIVKWVLTVVSLIGWTLIMWEVGSGFLGRR